MTSEDKKISSIYQQANSVEPPSHLDDAILAASCDAVATEHHVKSPFSGSWPISMVAVVIVAVIVVPIVVQESSQQDTAPLATTNTPISPPEKREAIVAREKQAAKAKLRMQSAPVSKADELTQSKPSNLSYAEPADSEVVSGQLMQAQPAAIPSFAAPGIMSVEEDTISEEAGFGRLMKQSTIDKDTQEKKATDSKNSAQKTNQKSIRQADEWLDAINKLIAENKLEEARVEWEVFEQSYPDHPDNERLKELLISHE